MIKQVNFQILFRQPPIYNRFWSPCESIMRLRAYLIFKPTFKYLPDETLSILVFKYILNTKSFKGAVGWKHKCLLLYKFWVIDYNTTISTENLTFVWLVYCTYEAGGVFNSVSKWNDKWRSKKYRRLYLPAELSKWSNDN